MDYSYLKDWREKALQKTSGRGEFLIDMFLRRPDDSLSRFDLHVHSDKSDGALDVRSLFQSASNNNLGVLSITDHDTILAEEDYYNYTIDTAKYNGQFLNGVEVTCKLKGLPVEVLVYDYNYKKAKKAVDEFEFPYLNRNYKLQRIIQLCEKRLMKLNALKILDRSLDINDFISLEIFDEKGNKKYQTMRSLGLDAKQLGLLDKNNTNRMVKIDGVDYKINYDNFISKTFKYIAKSEKGRDYLRDRGIDLLDKYAEEIDITSPTMPDMCKEAFSSFNRKLVQSNDGPFKVSDEGWWPTVEEVVEFAKNCGGVAIFAHPYGYSGVKESPEKLMRMAVEAGVDGIECLHGFNTADNVREIYQFCREHGLLITGGSDVHAFYSYQGGRTEVGIIPGNGKCEIIDGIRCTLQNLHEIGNGKYSEKERERGM